MLNIRYLLHARIATSTGDKIYPGYDARLTSDVASSFDTVSAAFLSMAMLARAGDREKEGKKCHLNKIKHCNTMRSRKSDSLLCYLE